MIPEIYTHFIFEHSGSRHKVFTKGEGPGVLLMHELPGMSEPCIRLGDRLAEAGFAVYLPLMFGEPGDFAPTRSFAKLCINREFTLFANNRSSPIVEWMRALGRRIHEERGGAGIGAIGMCLSGNFALSLMADESVLAPVSCEPALPMGFGKRKRRALAVSSEELQCARERAAAGVPLLGLRFSHDKVSPPERFERLRTEFGSQFEAVEIDSSQGNPHDIARDAHSVLTHDFVDKKGHPTRAALDRVLAFLKERLE